MLDTSKYKAALDGGDRKVIVARARAMTYEVGKTPLAPDAPHVNASAGQDNNAEKSKLYQTFTSQALGITSTADAYNAEIAAANHGRYEAVELVNRVQALETTHGNISEIERIDKGDAFGGGRGMEQGQVENEIAILKRIEGKLDKLLAK